MIEMNAGTADDFKRLRPSGGFRLIHADAPWLFKNWSEKGEAKNPVAHYDCMPTADIMALPVGLLAARDCLLFMWATFPMLTDAMEVMAAWGFTYKSGGAWPKSTVNGKAAFGTGYIFRASCEAFLVGTIGAPPIHSRSERNLIEGQLREHSRKPDSTYPMLERLCGNVSRIDLFARQRRKGWVAWGMETDKFRPAVAA
jgi:N6-adenosine-specific RNA methylase IME4